MSESTSKFIKNCFTFLFFVFSGQLSSQSFTTLWNTTNISSGSSAVNEITIPTNPAYTYSYTVDWGDGNIDSNVTGDITHTYASQGTYTVKIDGTFPAIYFNNAGDVNKIIEILSWGTIQWQSMENAFYGCENINFDAITPPDLSQVTSLQNAFRDCSLFNGIMNDWDVSTITNISGLFMNCEVFNRPLDQWNTIGITDMSYTFHHAIIFNEPLDNWNTSSVTTLQYFLSEASSFNQNINNWNTSNVTNMNGAFRYTNNYNQPMNNWDVSNVTDMTSTFQGSGFNNSINNWDVSNVTTMMGMFSQSKFNQPINSWNVSNVIDMSKLFFRNRTFNQPLNNWDVSNVTNMSSMFDGWAWDAVFNQPLNSWNVSSVTDMSFMFRENSAFNQDISSWNVSNVINMESMFEEATEFNQDISSWNVSNVTNMESMFQETEVFDQPLSSWNVGSVTNMRSMFQQTQAFNQPLNNWNVSNAVNFQNMFDRALLFNQDISTWVIASGNNMSNMFNQASAFNQNIGTWDISGVTNMTNMLSNSGISQENYDNILIAWSAQAVQNNVNLGATNLNYCDALSQRQNLIDNNGWTISGDIVNCSYVLCTQITMPQAGDTNVPANSDIRWNPAPNATGYRISVRRENGATSQVIYNNEDVGNVVGVDFTNEFIPGDTVYVTVVPYNAEGPATGCQEISFTVVASWVNSPDTFKLTYDTTLQRSYGTTSGPNQLEIETKAGQTYNYSIDWGDGQYNNNVTEDITHTYLVPGVYTVSIIGTFPAPKHEESSGDSYKLLSIDQWGTQVWQSMEGAFSGCENMEYNATDVPNLTNVTNMGRMFIACKNFNGNINNWDVSNVTNMYGMFGAASIFNQPLDNWDVSNVTNMNFMFARTSEFNQNIGGWDTGSVTDMSRMFQSAEVFDQPLNNWDVSSVTDMSRMFERAEAFNEPLNNWDVSNVTNMSEMFNGFISNMAFNQNIDNWNVSNVTDMSEMFQRCVDFNQPLNSWNVGAVTNMTSMFEGASSFNQALSNWNVSSVTNMQSMFQSASDFNQTINSWNVTNVTDMSLMFYNAQMFNQPLNSWDVNSVVNMSGMFRRAEAFNQPLNSWDVSAVANMSQMFQEATVFNQPLNSWNVSSVTLMPSMFEEAVAFNSPLENWNVSVVTNFEAMFKNAEIFNQPLGNWNTGEAQTMAEMFHGASAFNQDINNWNVSFVTTMQEMFRGATSFNRPLDSWNVASVTNMQGMFQTAIVFDGAMGSWNIRRVTTMQDMFNGATNFNQPMNNWRPTAVTNMDRMFQGASLFNQPLNQWLLNTVSMNAMFNNATAFNQDLGDWNISGVTNMQNMLDNTALTRVNYDNTLIAWSEQTLTPGINLGANTLPYCDAVEERQSMMDNFGWSFTGDVLDCPIPECTQLIAPLNGATDVPVNTNLTWESVLYAREYALTIRIEPSGTIINETVVNATTYEFATDFSGGETVYVTIVPSNENGDAVGPCTEESFTVSTTPSTVPDCTNLTLPLAGATDISVSTNLEWNVISNADGYRLTVGTTSGGTDILNHVDVGNNTTYSLSADLPEDTDVFVTITPYNDEGEAINCGEESFKTEFIPVPPTCTSLVNPINGATNVPVDTNLSWNMVADATGYLISVGTTQGGIEVVNSIDVGNITTYSFTQDLQENRRYYVRIIPYNNEGDAIGCSEESFVTGTAPINVPSCTSIISPANGTTDVSINTNITWDAVAHADGYYISIGTNPGGNDIVNNEAVTTTSYSLADELPENTTIHVSVIPYNSTGSAIGCSEISFTTEIVPTAPNCTTITVPSDGGTNVAVDTNITWNTVSDADGYYISIGTTSGGTDIVNNESVVGTSYTLASDLPENTTIYVSVIPYNSTGSATGCSEISFTTEIVPTAPSCTTITVPSNGATNVSVSTGISWNTVSDADGYYISIGTTSGGTDIVNNESVVGTSYTLASDLPENTTIYVSVIPYNSTGSATGCSEISFTTETIATAPDCTSIISPANGATDISISTDISWDAVAHADGYYITIGTNPGGTDIVNNESVVGTSYAPTNDFPENTTIHVSVIPYNSTGSATGCSEISFTTEIVPTAPNCTTITVPSNGATNVSVSTGISWNTVSDADGYYISIGTTSGGTDIVNNESVVGTSYTLASNLPENTTIYVSVIPYNSTGSAIGCSEISFTTETTATAPDCTSIISPVNGTTDVSISTDISWDAVADADGYYITIGTNPGGTDIVNNEAVTATTYKPTINLPENSTVYVSLLPYGLGGLATGCGEISFTTEAVAVIPDCATIISPANGATDVSINTNITWDAVAHADGYYITIGTNPGGNDIVNNESVTTTSYSLADELPENTTIHVSVIPYNAFGNATGCTGISFATEMDSSIKTKYGFSPNGDGINDFWEIKGIENYPDNKVSVYNRWGDLVFQTDRYDNRANIFTGVANKHTKIGGGKLPAGTYFFQIQVSNGNIATNTKGFLVIKR
ncbi:BspA family leucine-rich repeat surface protein [Zhouia spongiae]|uniref:BspA family leucine-rich repeat surface protein n=1 Tax=Zhouia spongiae TaxID=2202721 RepID=A0ABY3YJV4_9FLAO|nr:BspA family leucine-rich repeat surface protein [Zhouia spongiae]UNY97931.1 BspA family leucine-rich repeat surface protein [Zhouia spongiae]